MRLLNIWLIFTFVALWSVSLYKSAAFLCEEVACVDLPFDAMFSYVTANGI